MKVRGAFEYAVPQGSPWRNTVVHFPSLHACAVQAPVADIGKFLGSNLFQKEQAVAALLLDERVDTPEGGGKVPVLQRSKPVHAEDRTGGGQRDKTGSSREPRAPIAKRFRELRDPLVYMDTLKIGAFSSLWVRFTDRGRFASWTRAWTNPTQPCRGR